MTVFCYAAGILSDAIFAEKQRTNEDACAYSGTHVSNLTNITSDEMRSATNSSILLLQKNTHTKKQQQQKTAVVFNYFTQLPIDFFKFQRF